MARFSRRTVLETIKLLDDYGHAGIDRFLLEHGLENVAPQEDYKPSKFVRVNMVVQYLLADRDKLNEYGENLLETVVEDLIQSAANEVNGPLRKGSSELARHLARDGYVVESGALRKTLPEALDLPAADDEVHILLDRHSFSIAKGHLDQAIDAHSRGNWAAANSQLRAFVEGLLDEIAASLVHSASDLPDAGHERRQWLAALPTPFFLKELNEWSDGGKGFINQFYRRLHPRGSHPGLSDEEDSTFRLHLVLLVARLLLRRFDQRVLGV